MCKVCKTLTKSWYFVLLCISLIFNLLHIFITSFGQLRPKLLKYSIISLNIPNNPMCTTPTLLSRFITLSYPMFITYLIFKKHTHKLLYCHSLYLVNITIGRCFTLTRRAPLNGEIFPRQRAFPLRPFRFPSMKTSTHGTCVIRPTTNEWWWCLRIHFSPFRPTTTMRFVQFNHFN